MEAHPRQVKMYPIYFFGIMSIEVFSIWVERKERMGLEFQHFVDSCFLLKFDVEDCQSIFFMLAQQDKIGSLQQKKHIEYDLVILQGVYAECLAVIFPYVDNADSTGDVPSTSSCGVQNVVL